MPDRNTVIMAKLKNLEKTTGTQQGGSGDMLKATYDPNNDGVIANAQLSSDVNSAVSLKHDGSTQDTTISGKTTLSAVKSDSDISDAISKKHSNSLDHSNSADHSHTNKSTLDTYTQTEANLADAVTKKHSNSLDHAPGSDNQDLSGKSDVGHTHSYEPANANIQTHVTSGHAPSNAQKNSDITKGEIEAVLTGEISSHSHAGGSGGLSQPQVMARSLGC